MKKKMFILCGLLIEKSRTAMKTTSRKEKRSNAPVSVCQQKKLLNFY
jgi:hypothetical protein